MIQDIEAVSHLREGTIGACSYTKSVGGESHMAWKGQYEKRVDVADSGGEAENGISRGLDLAR